MDLTLMKPLDSLEIRTALEKASAFGGKVAQPTLTSNTISVIKRIDVDSGNTLKIKLFEEPILEKGRPINIQLNYRNLSFRLNAKEYSVNGSTLVIHYPKEAKALASRDISERFILPYNSKIECFSTRVERRDKDFDINAHILDFSQRGLGLIIPKTEEGMIVKHDHLWIRSLHNVVLSQPIFGRVVYVTQKKYLDGHLDLRVGISLDTDLPEEMFNELKALASLVLTA